MYAVVKAVLLGEKCIWVRIRDVLIMVDMLLAGVGVSMASVVSEGDYRAECERFADNLDYAGLRRAAEGLLWKASEADDHRMECFAHYYMSMSCLKTGDIDMARKHAVLTDSLASVLANDSLKACGLNLLGIIATEGEQNNAHALAYFMEGLRYAQNAGSISSMSSIYNNISFLFTSQNDPAGINYALKSLELSRANNLPDAEFYAEYNLASIYLLKNELEEAEKHASHAADLARLYGYSDAHLPQVLLATVLHRKGNSEGAMELLDSVITSNMTQNPNSSVLTKAYCEKARILHDRHSYEASDSFCRMAMASIDSSGRNTWRLDVEELMARNAAETGRYDKACTLLWGLSDELKDLLYRQNQGMHHEIQASFEIINRENRIRLQAMRLDYQRRMTWVLIAMAGILLLAVFTLYRFYIREKNLRRAIVAQFQLQDHIDPGYTPSFQQPDGPNQEGEDVAGAVESDTRGKRLFDRLVRQMESEKLYAERNISREWLADRLSTNRTYITRIVRENTGLSLPQWINQLRVREARRLLTDTSREGMSIKEIGEAVGFLTPSTFNSVFKSITGLSPSSYRKDAQSIRNKSFEEETEDLD